MTITDPTPTPLQADELRGRVARSARALGVAEWPPRFTVAFSGGLDSTVLLATLCRLSLPAPVRAAHVDHGLHPRSADWSAHCARVAAAHGAEFSAVRVAVDRTAGQGLEAAAREARYRALGELLSPGEWLLTAHHADDQLETLLLRMLRGTGVRGLRGIIPFAPFRAGWLARPLLDFTRDELRAQAFAWSLCWIEDPSNGEPHQDRNYLRLHVLPALRARWPDAAQRAVRLAEQMGDAERLLEAVAAEDARPLAAPWHVPRSVLAALEPARQRNLLRRLLREVGLGTPSSRKLEELRTALLEAHSSSHALVRWPSGEGRVFRDALYLGASLPSASPPDYTAFLGTAGGWSGPEGYARVGACATRSRPARFMARRRPHAALSRRRRAFSAPRPRASSLAEGLVPGERRRAVDARSRAAALSRYHARRDRRSLGQRGRRRGARARASLARALDAASAPNRTGTALTESCASRGWSGLGTFDTLHSRLRCI